MSGRINTLGHNLIELTGGADVTSNPSSSRNNRVDSEEGSSVKSTLIPNSKAEPAIDSKGGLQPSSTTPSGVDSEQQTN